MIAVHEPWFDRVARAIAAYFRRASHRGSGAGAAALGAGRRTPCTGHDLAGIADEKLARLRVACRT